MSITPTAGRQAPNSSGRWVITAPTSSPPLLPPWMASLSRPGVLVGDEPLGGGDEVVEDVLLLELRARLVPGLAVFAAAAQVGLGVDAAHLQPGQLRLSENIGGSEMLKPP